MNVDAEKIHIPCSRCAGCGFVEIPEVYGQAVNFLREYGPSTAADMHAAIGKRQKVGLTAINNRLEWLRKARLISRQRRDGKTFEYSVVK